GVAFFPSAPKLTRVSRSPVPLAIGSLPLPFPNGSVPAWAASRSPSSFTVPARPVAPETSTGPSSVMVIRRSPLASGRESPSKSPRVEEGGQTERRRTEVVDRRQQVERPRPVVVERQREHLGAVARPAGRPAGQRRAGSRRGGDLGVANQDVVRLHAE